MITNSKNLFIMSLVIFFPLTIACEGKKNFNQINQKQNISSISNYNEVIIVENTVGGKSSNDVQVNQKIDLSIPTCSKSREIEISSIDEAELLIDIFEVDGGIHSNKIVNLNGCSIGLLPYSAPPYSSWQTVSIKLSSKIISGLSLTNSVGILDKTEDAYNIRNVSLKMKLKGSEEILSCGDTNSFSSVGSWWPFKQGKLFKRDGSPFVYLYL